MPLWIQKQSNYRHSPYYLPCLQERVAREAKPRFGAVLGRSAHDCAAHLFLSQFLIQDNSACGGRSQAPRDSQIKLNGEYADLF